MPLALCPDKMGLKVGEELEPNGCIDDSPANKIKEEKEENR